MTRILFVCLGNICRSCAAEEILRQMVERYALDGLVEVDSAGLERYHQGQLADHRMRRAAMKRGFELTHRSRPVTSEDLHHFDHIYTMDADIQLSMERMARKEQVDPSKITLVTRFCPHLEIDEVPDPYYGDMQDFEYVLDLLEDICQQIVECIKSNNL